MSEKTPSIEKLEKQLRVLKKKLERSEWHRVDLENQHDRDQHLYRRLHADLEAARREAEIKAALERVRTKAMAMQKPEDLSGISETVFTELKALGFTDLRNTEIIINHDTKESITSYYYSDYGVTGVIDVDYRTNSTLAAWAREMQKADDAFAKVVIAEDEMEAWRDYRLSLGYVPDPKLDESTAVYYYSYSIGLGALSISSFQPVDAEQLSVLEQFRNVFNLAYQRYVDIARAEAQAREAQIQLALERIRAQSMLMQHSSELVATSTVFHEQLQALGVPTEFSYVWLPDEAAGKHQFWATWTEEEDGAPVHRSKTITYDLDKEEPYTAACFAAWESEERLLVDFIPPSDIGHFFGTWEELVGGAEHLRSEHFLDGIYYAEGYMQYGCFGINIRREPTEAEQDILRRFAIEFERAYTRFLDLGRAEAQAREAQIEAALEKVRSRSLAVNRTNEFNEVVTVVFEKLSELDIPASSVCIATDTEEPKAFDMFGCGESESGLFTLKFGLPYFSNPFMDDIIHERSNSAVGYFSKIYTEKEKNIYYKYVLKNTELKNLPNDIKQQIWKSKSYGLSTAYARHSMIMVNDMEGNILDEAQADILKRFSRVFDQAYTRFLDLQKAEAQAREAQIEAALERVRSRTMAMHESAELGDVIQVVFREALRLGFGAMACDLVILDEATDGSTFWISGELDEADEALHFRVPPLEHPHYTEGLVAWKNGETVRQIILEGEVCAAYMQQLTEAAEDSNVPDEVEAFIQGLRHIVHTEAYIRYGYFRVASLDPLGETAQLILRRFARVFEQTYTRFLDLKQAEARAREAEIEAALERVRSRTMAMQSSEELSETASLLFHQIKNLGFETWSCGFCTWQNDEMVELWMGADSGELLPPMQLPYAEDPTHNDIYQAHKEGVETHHKIWEGKALEKHYANLRTIPSVAKAIDVLEDSGLTLPAKQCYYVGFFKQGYLLLITIEPNDELKELSHRFTKVFEQTYTRFLDLKQAEARAREAQIEAALERVRSRTMAMHHSDEIAEVASVTFEQFQGLAFPTIRRISIGVMDTEANTMSFWASATTQGGSIRRVTVPMEKNATVRETVAGWRAGKPYFSLSCEGNTLQEFVAHITQHGWEYPAGEQMPERLLMNFASYKYGLINASTYEPIGEDEYAILQRFARVFEQTYTRFLDLKQAEAQAREAQIEASLERVRAHAMGLRKSDDLEDVIAIIFEELEKLGLALYECSIFLRHGISRDFAVWARGHTEESVLSNYQFPFIDHPILNEVIKDLDRKTPYREFSLGSAEIREYGEAIFAQTDLKHSPQEYKDAFMALEEVHIGQAMFNHGFLEAVGTQPLPEDVAEILKRFTQVIDLTYTRFLDLQKAEAQAREAEIEASLERVRARAMAMHSSEDLSDATAIVFAELERLGIASLRCGVVIIDDTRHMDTWTATATAEEHDVRVVGRIDMTIHPLLEGVFDAWKAQQPYYVYEMIGEDMQAYYQAVARETSYPLPEQRVLSPRQFCYTFFFPEGALFVFTEQALAEESIQVFNRFTSVFALTYTRFLDLKKAEAQAREAEIELALERVRARTMAMQKSEELSETSALLFSQIKELGIETWTSGFNIWEEDERACIGYNATPAGGLGVPMRLPLTEDPFFQTIHEAKQRGDEFLVFESDGESLAETYRYMFTLPVVKDVMQGIVDEGFDLPEYQVTHCGFFSHGHLMFITLEPCPEAWDVFKRFTKVFEQTYTRFLDLQKAEAQAREAEIEASLERVRGRAMAMHSSDDLSDATAIVFEELERLGITTHRCGINIIHDSGHMDLWTATATDEDSDLRVLGRLDKTMHPMLEGVYEAWKAEQPYFTYALAGEDMQTYYQALRDAPEYAFPKDANPSGSHFAHLFNFPEGGLFAFTEQPLAEETIQVVQRFAAVFALTYRRYLDLKQAEEQAREAQIEAALEKVRSRTMAMRKPDELQEVVTVVAEKLQDLGVIMDAGGVIICTYFPHSKDVVHWLASSDFSSSKPYLLPYFGHRIFEEAWHSRESGDAFFSKAYSVEEKNSFFLHAFEHSDYKYFPDDFKEWVLAAEHHALTFAWSKNAAILIPSFTDIFPSESDKEILKRFANVFEQAYVRFLDLQQAEAQAREAVRQASLDRVRAEIASMRNADDLQRITPLIWRELTTLGVPFFRCGIFIIDETTQTVQVFLTTPEGKALAALPLGFEDAPIVAQTVAHWRQERVYVEEWEASDMQAWTAFLQERGLIQQPTRYLDAEAPPEHLALHFVPFEQGMLYVGSTAPLAEKEVELVQALADAFAIAYARYEDFQRLEAKNREVEAAMDELKATQQQLVQSEKMASLGQLTAGIAHEIKNPLNFVNNFAALSQDLVDELEEETDPDEIQAILADLKLNAAKIEEHGKRADSIVRSMMQHARVGSGERETVALNKFVDEYVDLSWHGKRAQTPDFNAEVVRDYDEAVGRIDVVPQDLGRVLINLLSNAFDAVHEHAAQNNGQYAPEVVVSTRRLGDAVEIRVADNGPGIPADVKAKIFEPFFTTKPTGQGTGLGLSLSYDIVTQGHGGTLTVDSEPGQGAAFVVTLLVSCKAPVK